MLSLNSTTTQTLPPILGGDSFDAYEALGQDNFEDLLALAGVDGDDIIFANGASFATDSISLEDRLILSDTLNLSSDKLRMYDADTILGLLAIAKAMEAAQNGDITGMQKDLLQNADEFLDQLYDCCASNTIKGDGTETIGVIDTFKNWVDEQTLTGTFTDAELEAMLSGLEDSYVGDGVFGATLSETYVTGTAYLETEGTTPEITPVTANPAQPKVTPVTTNLAQPKVTPVTTNLAQPEEEVPVATPVVPVGDGIPNQKGDAVAEGTAAATHDHNGDGLLDHNI